jgi:tetratricopeptide (TPR) repeat protein
MGDIRRIEFLRIVRLVDDVCRHPLNSVRIHTGIHASLKGEQEAIGLYERSLSIRRAKLGARHPSVGETMNDLALIYFDGEDYKKAEQLLRKALSILESAQGAEARELAPILNNLALTLTGKGETEEGLRAIERAIRICENGAGPDSPAVISLLVSYLQNFGGLLALSGKPVEAERVYNRAILLSDSRTPSGSDETEDLRRELKAIKAGTFKKRVSEFWQSESGV